MAHEELKAMYEIDKRHSDDPDQYWEIKGTRGNWIPCGDPVFFAEVEYRRKPDAPVWPVRDDAEDARKWRELEAFYQGNGIMDTAKKFLEIIEPKPQLIQGYTAEQWQAIIDGKFLCEFSDAATDDTRAPLINRGFLIRTDLECGWFFDEFGIGHRTCRPLRMKGVRQPWFGGECPVGPKTFVLPVYSCSAGRTAGEAQYFNWAHTGGNTDIVEFIEL